MMSLLETLSHTCTSIHMDLGFRLNWKPEYNFQISFANSRPSLNTAIIPWLNMKISFLHVTWCVFYILGRK